MKLRRVIQLVQCVAPLTAVMLPGCATTGSDDEVVIEDETDMNANPRRDGLPSWDSDGVRRGVAVIPFNGITLHADAVRRLHPVFDRLQAQPLEHAILAGYSREQDSSEYTRQLAEARACVVRDWLADKGIAPDRLHTVCLAPGSSMDRDAVEIAVFTPKAEKS